MVVPPAPLSLRPYQREAIAAVIAARKAGSRRLLICLPTGAGKTVIFSQLARLAKKSVLVLAHREELLSQAREKIERAIDGSALVAIEQGANRAPADAKVLVCSIRSLHQERLEQVAAAGGEVTGTVELDPAWTDPDAAATREDALAALPDLALNGVEGDAGTPTALAAALATSVVAGDDGLVGSASAAGSLVLEALSAADLADVEGEPSLRAGTALVVAPAAGAAPIGRFRGSKA